MLLRPDLAIPLSRNPSYLPIGVTRTVVMKYLRQKRALTLGPAPSMHSDEGALARKAISKW